MRKVIFIVLLFFSLRTFISCCKEVGFNFRWSKAIITNINVSSNIPTPLIPDSSKIVNYGFRLTLEAEQVAYHFINDFAFNKTYALKCIANYQNKDSVIFINVITQNNLDNTHPAGSSISDFLLARPGSMYFDPTPYPYDIINANIYYINQNNSISNNILDFKFKNITPFLGEHKFLITVLFKSGRVLSNNTAIRLY